MASQSHAKGYRTKVLHHFFDSKTATSASFGLPNDDPDRWSHFLTAFKALEQSETTRHKVLFLARHGQGSHNEAEAKYGTTAWDDHWSKLNGDDTLVWGPDPELTALGRRQVAEQKTRWQRQLAAGAPFPQAFLVSPFTRAASTLKETWSFTNVTPPPVFCNLLRERNGEHTCDNLRPRHRRYLAERFPDWNVEDIPDEEEDASWSPDKRETFEEQQARSAEMLQSIASMPEHVIYIASHSGTIETTLAALGHPVHPLGPGGPFFFILTYSIGTTQTHHRLDMLPLVVRFSRM